MNSFFSIQRALTPICHWSLRLNINSSRIRIFFPLSRIYICLHCFSNHFTHCYTHLNNLKKKKHQRTTTEPKMRANRGSECYVFHCKYFCVFFFVFVLFMFCNAIQHFFCARSSFFFSFLFLFVVQSRLPNWLPNSFCNWHCCLPALYSCGEYMYRYMLHGLVMHRVNIMCIGYYCWCSQAHCYQFVLNCAPISIVVSVCVMLFGVGVCFILFSLSFVVRCSNSNNNSNRK